MSVTIDVSPFSGSIDMLGVPDESSAYTVSGHVSISLRSTSSLFERRCAVRLLLQSLIITFEGQSELVTPETGYSAVRLCSISQELAPADPVEFSNEGHEDSDKACTWNVVFNLPIPGWLPPTDVFGDCHEAPPGTRYTLYATAKLAHVDEGSSGYSWLSSLCSPFLFRTKVVHSRAREITLNRFGVPPAPSSSSLPSVYSLCNYSISTVTPTSNKSQDSHPIPRDVLSKLQVVVSVPDHVSTQATAMPFTLRLRAPGLSDEDASKLAVTQFSIELEQVEKYRSTASTYAARYPLPRECAQPPNKPLRDAHPVHALYDVGLLVGPQPRYQAVEVASSLLPDCIGAQYPVEGTGNIFDRSLDVDPEQWYTMQTNVPFVHLLPASGKYAGWTSNPRLRASGQSPFFGVKHSMHVSVACTYSGVDGEVPATENLKFTLPITFVCLRPAPVILPVRVQSLPQHISSVSSAPPISMPPSLPYAFDLPAYSQLFYSNGDRKIDYSVPLPLYTPPPSSTTESLSDEDSSDARDGLKVTSRDAYEMTPLLTDGHEPDVSL